MTRLPRSPHCRRRQWTGTKARTEARSHCGKPCPFRLRTFAYCSCPKGIYKPHPMENMTSTKIKAIPWKSWSTTGKPLLGVLRPKSAESFKRRKINDAGQYDLRINLGLDPGHAGIVCKTESNAGRRQSASIRYGLTRSMQVAVF